MSDVPDLLASSLQVFKDGWHQYKQEGSIERFTDFMVALNCLEEQFNERKCTSNACIAECAGHVQEVHDSGQVTRPLEDPVSHLGRCC